MKIIVLYHPRNETCFQMLDFIHMHPAASNRNMLSNVGSYSYAVQLQQCKYDTTVRIRVQAQGVHAA